MLAAFKKITTAILAQVNYQTFRLVAVDEREQRSRVFAERVIPSEIDVGRLQVGQMGEPKRFRGLLAEKWLYLRGRERSGECYCGLDSLSVHERVKLKGELFMLFIRKGDRHALQIGYDAERVKDFGSGDMRWAAAHHVPLVLILG